jgi:hypothetical protein
MMIVERGLFVRMREDVKKKLLRKPKGIFAAKRRVR